MAHPIPPLNALRAFEVTARLGTLARAADELCVTASAVGHQVKNLEDWLGLPQPKAGGLAAIGSRTWRIGLACPCS